MVQQIFTLVPRLNPSLGFVTGQEIQNTTNNKKKTEAKPCLGRLPAPSNDNDDDSDNDKLYLGTEIHKINDLFTMKLCIK